VTSTTNLPLSTLGEFAQKSQPSISSWTPPSDWDLDPNHPDDKITSYNAPFLTLTHTEDRYGGEYWGFGGNLGKGFPVSSTMNVGSLKTADDIDVPMSSDLSEFLSGYSINVSGGAIIDLSMTWNPLSSSDRVANSVNEYGMFIPYGIGVSATFNWKIK
jgi:hypothetical protein